MATRKHFELGTDSKKGKSEPLGIYITALANLQPELLQQGHHALAAFGRHARASDSDLAACKVKVQVRVLRACMACLFVASSGLVKFS